MNNNNRSPFGLCHTVFGSSSPSGPCSQTRTVVSHPHTTCQRLRYRSVPLGVVLIPYHPLHFETSQRPRIPYLGVFPSFSLTHCPLLCPLHKLGASAGTVHRSSPLPFPLFPFTALLIPPPAAPAFHPAHVLWHPLRVPHTNVRPLPRRVARRQAAEQSSLAAGGAGLGRAAGRGRGVKLYAMRDVRREVPAGWAILRMVCSPYRGAKGLMKWKELT